MKKKTADAEGNDDIEEAFRVFDTKNDGYILASNSDCLIHCFLIAVLSVWRS